MAFPVSLITCLFSPWPLGSLDLSIRMPVAWLLVFLSFGALSPFRHFVLVMWNSLFWTDKQRDDCPLTLCVLAFLGGGRQSLLDQQASLRLREEGEEQVRALEGSGTRCVSVGGPCLAHGQASCRAGGEVRRGTGAPWPPSFPALLLQPGEVWREKEIREERNVHGAGRAGRRGPLLPKSECPGAGPLRPQGVHVPGQGGRPRCWGSSLGSRDPQTEPFDSPAPPRLTCRHRGGLFGPLRLSRCVYARDT